MSELANKGEYLNLPSPLFFKPQKFKIVVWKDTPAQNVLLECIFSTLKTALKIEQKMWKHEKLQISWKRLEILPNPQYFSLMRNLKVLRKERFISFNEKKYFLFQIGRSF